MLASETSAGSEMNGTASSTMFRWPRSPRGTPWGLEHISLRMIVARNLFAFLIKFLKCCGVWDV